MRNRCRERLKQFATKAWRRPVQTDELADYIATYQEEVAAGESVAAAFQTAMQGILTSRNFIYLVEGEPTPRPLVTPHELASRLSYFLWSSMPETKLKKQHSLTG